MVVDRSMDYVELIKELISNFQSSLNFYILSRCYKHSNYAANYLDKYASIVNDGDKSIEEKYFELKDLLENSMDIAYLTVSKVDGNVILEHPNFNLLDEALASDTTRTLDSISTILSREDLKKYLFDKEIYNLYIYYYQIANLVNKNNLDSNTLSQYVKLIKNRLTEIEKRRTKITLLKQVLDENKIIKESVTTLNKVLEDCKDPDLVNNILEQLNDAADVIESRNDAIVDLKIFEDFNYGKPNLSRYNPYLIEKETINNNEVSIITDYKTAGVIYADKGKRLMSASDSDEALNIETYMNVYLKISEILSSNIKVQVNQSFLQLRQDSQTYEEIANLSKEVSDYSELLKRRDELKLLSKEVEENLKIYNGSLTLKWLLQQKEKMNNEVFATNEEISKNEHNINSLNDDLTNYLEIKDSYQTQNFIKRLISSIKVIRISLKIKEIRKKIASLEGIIKNSEQYANYLHEQYQKQETNFLENHGLSGMTFEEYEERLNYISSNAKELASLTAISKIQDELSKVEEQIQILRESNYYQNIINTVEDKKRQVGLLDKPLEQQKSTNQI